jgi:GT2 family glycosyltransferase
MGYRCLYLPDCIVYHTGYGSSSARSNFSIYYGHRNLIQTYWKNMPMALLIFSLPQHLFLLVVKFIYLAQDGCIASTLKNVALTVWHAE